MLVQVRTDNHIENSLALEERVRAEVEGTFGQRYGAQLRRVEVYLQDMNSHKGGVAMQCSIEAHLAGMQPIAVNSNAATVDDALNDAVDKLAKTLEHRLGRLADRGGRVSMSGNET